MMKLIYGLAKFSNKNYGFGSRPKNFDKKNFLFYISKYFNTRTGISSSWWISQQIFQRFDYKTQEKYSKKNHSLQIGGYVSLFYQNYPNLSLFSCRIIYITPDGIKTQEYNPNECMYDYEQDRKLYFKNC